MTTDCKGHRFFSVSCNSLHAPPHLPFDLVTEILCRLHVKHLLQLRCVCKSWNSLISHDSNFAKKHLRLSTSNHHRHHLILFPTSPSREFHLSHSSISASTITFTPLKHPLILTKGDDYYERVTTCHGMLSVRIDPSNVLLCNPSIRKFKILPPLLNPNQKSYLQTSFTLVYDRFTNNYKVVALSLRNNREKEVNIHTLGTNDWRRIQDLPSHDLIQRPGIFVSDSVNWLAYEIHGRSSYGKVVVSLHLKNELYQEFLHPLHDEQFETSITLGALRDCLCIFSHSRTFFDVWIMKEYGNVKSWTKLLRVPYIGDRGLYWYTKTLYISEDDQVFMNFLKMRKFSLVVYDSIDDTFKIPEILLPTKKNIPEIQYNIHDLMVAEDYLPEVYVESLISPFSQY